MTHVLVISAVVALGLAGLAVWLSNKRTASQLPEVPTAEADSVITNSIGMEMVPIPAGEFLMGSPDSDPLADDQEKPQHHVQISKPFYLGVYPVTQEQYERVMGDNPSGCRHVPNRPAENVSWEDAQEFCRKLSALPEEKSSGHVYRLPTEAEWEYACRAGSTTRYYFGDSAWDDQTGSLGRLGGYAWFAGNAEGTTHAVGQKEPNAWRLHDMLGNVAEWCEDRCQWDYYKQSIPIDPRGPSSGPSRVLRGGSWRFGTPDPFRCSYRQCELPDCCRNWYGFRVAMTHCSVQARRKELAVDELKSLVVYHAEGIPFSDANIQTMKAVLEEFRDWLDAQTEVKTALGRETLWFDPKITAGRGGGALLQVGVFVPDDATGVRFTDQLHRMATSRGL